MRYDALTRQVSRILFSRPFVRPFNASCASPPDMYFQHRYLLIITSSIFYSIKTPAPLNARFRIIPYQYWLASSREEKLTFQDETIILRCFIGVYYSFVSFASGEHGNIDVGVNCWTTSRLETNADECNNDIEDGKNNANHPADWQRGLRIKDSDGLFPCVAIFPLRWGIKRRRYPWRDNARE